MLLLTHRFPVLSETFVVELAVALAEEGVDLNIVASELGNDSELAFPSIASHGLASRLIRPDGTTSAALLEFLRRGQLPMRLLASSAVSRDLSKKLARAAAFARAGSVDVAHCQFAQLGALALRHRAFGALRCRRIVVHLRGWDITAQVQQRGETAVRNLFARADFFVANCAHFRDRALAFGCAPDRIVVVGSPIDVARFTPPEVRRSPDGRLRIAAVGRLVEKKGFADVLAAMALLRNFGVQAELEIIGDGPLRAALSAQIASLDLGDSVKLLGAQSSAEVLALLRRSDVFIAASVTAASGDQDAPVNTLKEAMATELPVVATRHGGIPELVEDGVHGRLAPERDPAALAAALSDIATLDEQSRRQMGCAGRRVVRDRFARPVVARRTVAAYVKALEMERTA